MRLPGCATEEGTAAYAGLHEAPDGHFRRVGGLTFSSIGMGTYLGEVSDAAGTAYEEAAVHALTHGVNVIDTASNYRDQQSERDIGRALRRYVHGGGRREHVVVSTKAGFLHGDAGSDMRPPDWFQKEYVLDGTVAKRDIVENVHCMTPGYIGGELDRSLDNLGVDTVDVFFLHNPETQLAAGVPEEAFYERVRDVFELLERRADAGDIQAYGVATWDGLRQAPGTPGHLQLVKLVHEAGEAARAVGRRASEHRFRAIQFPLNLAMPEALVERTQPWRLHSEQTVLACARELGLVTYASASLMQAKLRGRLPPQTKDAFGIDDDLEACLHFTRSAPGLTTALVGMGRPAHAKQDVGWAMARPPAPESVERLMQAAA